MDSLSRRSFIKAACAAAGAGACLAAAAPGWVGASEEGQDGGESQVIVAINTGSEPAAGFDPLVAWGCGEHVHEPLIQSTLIATDESLGFVNDLATSYEASDDGMSWTFKVRDDAYFTDGERLTARDVAFTVNGIIESPASEADLSSVERAEAPDDETVVLTMKRPNNSILYTLAVMGIVPEHAYGEGYGANPVGSGRYILEQWDKGQQAILRANPDYYGEAPKMDRVVVVFMEEDAALAAAQAGQVDVAFTSPTLSDVLPGGYSLLDCKTVDSRGISLPCVPAGGTKADGANEYPMGNDVTCDIAVRRAINCGVDRQRLVDNVLNGYGSVAYSVGDGLPWTSPDMRVDTDLDKAASLLDEAGWAMGDDGVRSKDGVRASLDLYYAASDSVRQAIAAEFANQMAPLGIEVNIKGASWDEIYPHEFSDLIEWGWGSNSPIELYELTHSDGWGNYACYENDAVDAYLDEAVAQPEVEDSYRYWQLAQWDGEQGVAPQGAATWVWLANMDHLYYVRDGLKVAAQKPHPHGHGWSLLNNVDKWEWER